MWEESWLNLAYWFLGRGSVSFFFSMGRFAKVFCSCKKEFVMII